MLHIPRTSTFQGHCGQTDQVNKALKIQGTVLENVENINEAYPGLIQKEKKKTAFEKKGLIKYLTDRLKRDRKATII